MPIITAVTASNNFMSIGYTVALAGFSAFERNALTSCLRLRAGPSMTYAEVGALAQADFILADSDHPGVVGAVMNAHREADTVFIGGVAPEGAMLWLMRPIDAMLIVRDLDAIVALREPEIMPPTPMPHAIGRPAGVPASVPAETPHRRASDLEGEGKCEMQARAPRP